MAKFTNSELQNRIVPTLERLIQLRLPYIGAMYLRVVVNDLRNHLKMVSELERDTLKTFVKLTEHGDIVTRKDGGGKPTNVPIFEDEDEKDLAPTNADSEAAKAFIRFTKELMAKTYTCEYVLQSEHLMDDEHPWNAPASLIVDLGDLWVEESTKVSDVGE